MAKKVIKVSATQQGIREAIKQVKQYQSDVEWKTQLLVAKLAEIGVGIAQRNIQAYDAVFSGDLLSSINYRQGTVFQYGAEWYVYTDCPWAAFVEFGTGYWGNMQSHPLAGEKGWKYDVNDHGEKGWYYFKNGAWHWTNGMPARPFMLETAWDLAERVQKIAQEVFRYG